MTTLQVAQRLVEMCNQGQFREAVVELYADQATSAEAMPMPGQPAILEGKDAILQASDEWDKNNEVHGCVIEGPWPHGDQFIVTMDIDVTAKAGPMAGQRVQMKEACLYDVKDGKITGAKFCYAMPDC